MTALFHDPVMNRRANKAARDPNDEEEEEQEQNEEDRIKDTRSTFKSTLIAWIRATRKIYRVLLDKYAGDKAQHCLLRHV